MKNKTFHGIWKIFPRQVLEMGQQLWWRGSIPTRGKLSARSGSSFRLSRWAQIHIQDMRWAQIQIQVGTHTKTGNEVGTDTNRGHEQALKDRFTVLCWYKTKIRKLHSIGLVWSGWLNQNNHIQSTSLGAVGSGAFGISPLLLFRTSKSCQKIF